VAERPGGNGKPSAPYAWAIDEIARDRLTALDGRLGKLEGRFGEHETRTDARLDAIESVQTRRRDWLDGLAGLAKAVAGVFVTAATIGGAVLAWLNYARH
jgi:predicted transcriptional regulator